MISEKTALAVRLALAETKGKLAAQGIDALVTIEVEGEIRQLLPSRRSPNGSNAAYT